MSIDWKKEAENRKDEMLADLKTMLEIESVRDESKGTPEAPLGPGPKEALDKVLKRLNLTDWPVTSNSVKVMKRWRCWHTLTSCLPAKAGIRIRSNR